MPESAPDRVTEALKTPGRLGKLDGPSVTQLIKQARRSGLLGRVAEQECASLVESDVLSVHPRLNSHFLAAQRVCRAQQSEIRREVRYLASALASLKAPVVLLKGAAYVMRDLPAAQGRVFGDIDIMVPESVLSVAESLLVQNGWMSTPQSDYDQTYYRKWMHELPPMQHLIRGTSLDVHHAILPRTARLKPAPEKLFERALPLAGYPGMHVLAPEDMVLHSMTHLFLNDDLSYALRDLSDLDLLLRHFGKAAEFWSALPERALELDLERPLYYGLQQTAARLGTPIPATAMARAAKHAPGFGLRIVMDFIWRNALRAPEVGTPSTSARVSAGALYLRGHWMRMPLHLLARHVAIKALPRGDKLAGRTIAAAP